MTSLPFPHFVQQAPVDFNNKRSALVAVGTCRIDPRTCTNNVDEYNSICVKNKQQTLVDNDITDKEEVKKLKKKYMKEGVALASIYLQETLQLDVSVIDVQIVLESQQIIETDGCICACFLDAGCSSIVINATDLVALDAAKIPRDRIIASFSEETLCTKETIQNVLPFASTIDIPLDLSNADSSSLIEKVDNILGMVPEKRDKIIFDLEYSSQSTNLNDLTEMVSKISQKIKDGKGGIALTDPSAVELGYSFAACMKTDRQDGLFSTVVCTRNGEALGLVYSSKDSIVAALECGRGVYFSRSRKGLWRKGDTSGHYQTLHRLDVDCDGDALRFTVTQRGDDTAAFCHLNTLTCWGEPRGLRHLEQTLQERLKSAPEGSYTKRLFDDPDLLRDKLVEEAQELSEAANGKDVAGEFADVLYFAMVKAAKAGVSIDDAVAELDRRTRKVTRRKGDSKSYRIAAGNEILSKNFRK